MKPYPALLAELLSKELYSLRQQKSLTQEAMAERLRISSRAYSDLERGKYAASAPTLLFLFSMLEADAGSIRRLSRVSLFMGKNNGLWQYARALFFCEEIEFCNICEDIGIEQFYYNFYYKRGETYREQEGNARKDHTSKGANLVHM